jgi:hypothetical protein
MLDQLAENVARVRSEMEAACDRVGRSASEVTLVAVTKYAELDWVHGLIELGVLDLGESRPQQLVERAERLPGTVRWHLIGHLQRNKVKPILPRCVLIHSVDSLRLLERISAIGAERSPTEAGLAPADRSTFPRVLLEVNVAGEASKDGFTLAELRSQWDALQAVPHVELAGLMTMAPQADDPEMVRTVFRELRQLRDELATRAAPQVKLTELSMGMSGDFAVAIEEGATLVRIGSRLFEGL